VGYDTKVNEYRMTQHYNPEGLNHQLAESLDISNGNKLVQHENTEILWIMC
jgi:hypothetical protein